MWCIPKIDKEFIKRMESLLDLYAQPYNPLEPVINFDETNKQLLADKRAAKPGKIKKRDYAYQRNGTRNLFLTVEPKAGFRTVHITKRRTKKDFAHEIRRITHLARYRQTKQIHVVLDNLNTHFEKSFYETFSRIEADSLLKRIKFHYTPVHASWLNMAEIEISILGRQCLKRRIATSSLLSREIHAWKIHRNRQKATIQWKFTVKDAQRIFEDSYRTKLVE